MADNKLEILLTAETEQATKAIQQFAKNVGVAIKDGISIYDAFEAKIKEVETALKKASDPAAIVKLNAQLKELNSGFSNIKAGQFSSLLGGVTKSANSASQAALNLSRVAQDSAFGFIGIANNIEPLFQSFAQLRKESGSTGTALKSFLSALGGPAAIGIILGAIQLFDAYSNNYGIFAGNAKKAKQAQDDLTKSIEGFGDAVADSAGKELTSLNALVKGAQDVNLTQQQRIFYVDELQKKYPAYFGNLSKEQILAGDTSIAYDKLSKSILAAAKARAAQDVLSKIAAQQIKLDEERAKVAEETQNRIAKAQTGSRTITGGGIAPTSTTVTVTREEKIAQAQAGQAAALKRIDEQYAALNKQAEFYSKIVQDGAASTASLGQEFEKVKKVSPENTFRDLIEATNALLDAEKLSQTTKIQLSEAIQAQIKDQYDLVKAIDAARVAQEKKTLADKAAKLIAAVDGTQQAPADLAKNVGIPTTITQAQAENAAIVAAQVERLQLATENTNAAFALLSPSINQAFDALANGENATEALGQAIKQLIVQLIKAVVQAAILAAIMNAIAPGSSAAKGGFLGIFKGLLGFRANGGPVQGGGPYVVGENGPELFVPSTQGNIVPNMALAGAGGGNVSFEIRGDVLYGLLRRTQNNRNGNF